MKNKFLPKFTEEASFEDYVDAIENDVNITEGEKYMDEKSFRPVYLINGKYYFLETFFDIKMIGKENYKKYKGIE